MVQIKKESTKMFECYSWQFFCETSQNQVKVETGGEPTETSKSENILKVSQYFQLCCPSSLGIQNTNHITLWN